VSKTAQNQKDLERLLEERQKLRQVELVQLWRHSFAQLAASPTLLTESKNKSDQWKNMMRLFDTDSFDSFVRYFAGFLPTQSTQQSLREPDATYSISAPARCLPTTSISTNKAEPPSHRPAAEEQEYSKAIPGQSQKSKSTRSCVKRIQRRMTEHTPLRRSARIEMRREKTVSLHTQEHRRTNSTLGQVSPSVEEGILLRLWQKLP
jgi:hypothetical protein